MTEQRLTELFNRWLDRQTSREEEGELFAGLKDHSLESTWQALIESAWDRLPQIHQMSDEQANTIFQQIIPRKTKIYTLRKLVAAASILICIGLAAYLYTTNRKTKDNQTTITQSKAPILAPTSTHAIITLAGGQQIIVDSANGTLANQGFVKITKLDNGEITYTGTDKEISYNTLMNPRGSRVVTITLNDGTRVWLNAESSLKYPTAFTGKERRVEITGEAYFEVSHNPAMPFIVSKGETSIQVLGTHFNVNAYEDENSINITLLEGTVNVSSNTNHQRLLPGEQAIVQPGEIKLAKNVDINHVMAWKNGKFYFGARADLGQIMRQIARWYDIEVVYQGKIPPQTFGGEMPRSSDLNQVLEILKTSGVHFTIEKRKVIVMP